MAQQQKLMVALCLMGALAMVSAQQLMDPQACASALRAEAERYRSSMQNAASKFAQSIQEHGNQAMDTSSFQGDIDKLTQSINSMADMSQGFDPSRFMGMYMDTMQTFSSLMRSSMRLSLVSGAMRQYIEFGSTVYTLNTNFLERATNSCMSQGNMRIALPAGV